MSHKCIQLTDRRRDRQRDLEEGGDRCRVCSMYSTFKPLAHSFRAVLLPREDFFNSKFMKARAKHAYSSLSTDMGVSQNLCGCTAGRAMTTQKRSYNFSCVGPRLGRHIET